MTKEKVKVTSVDRVNAYHANRLVEEASKFASVVIYETADKRANGKSIIGLISMGLRAGDRVTISCDGTDEKEALRAVVLALGELR